MMRKYGNDHPRLLALHGGPGAGGSLKDLCEELGKTNGVLEYIEDALTIKESLRSLHQGLLKEEAGPITVLGHSWGAMQAILFTAAYPQLVDQLVLVGSGLLEEEGYAVLRKNRAQRMTPAHMEEIGRLTRALQEATEEEKDSYFSDLGRIMDALDAVDPIDTPRDEEYFSYRQHQSLWKEALATRQEGGFIRALKKIEQPVVVYHGSHDPHPLAYIEKSLKKARVHYQLHILEQAGHYPWREKQAREGFLKSLTSYLGKY